MTAIAKRQVPSRPRRTTLIARPMVSDNEQRVTLGRPMRGGPVERLP